MGYRNPETKVSIIAKIFLSIIKSYRYRLRLIVCVYIVICFWMTNLLNELVYVSLADARDTSEVFTTTVPTDVVLTKLLTEAQWIIDTYIQSYWTKEVETQTFIFPTEDDWIPYEIQLATIWIAELLYSKWQSLNTDKVVSESNLWRSISFSDKQGFDDYVKTIWIPPKVLNILDKYRNDFIWQVV